MKPLNHTLTTRPVTTLFLDIGNVLLTNGWDHVARQQAAEAFDLDIEEMNERHHLTYDTYEEGKLDLDGYLKRVVFYKDQPFSMDAFRSFMYSRSQPNNEMIGLVQILKNRYHLKTVAVSNEGRELTVYRIQQFNLREVIDSFVSSCFVHCRKPDPDIYHIALDISQAPPDQVVYIDDRLLFVDVAKELGIHGIHHTGFQTTRSALAELELRV